MKVKCENLELRGIANHTSKKTGSLYYILNVETADGTPYALYCPRAEALPQGLRKGEAISVLFNVSNYQGNERLIVAKVERAENAVG